MPSKKHFSTSIKPSRTFHVECDVSSINRRRVPYHMRLKSNFDRLLYIIAPKNPNSWGTRSQTSTLDKSIRSFWQKVIKSKHISPSTINFFGQGLRAFYVRIWPRNLYILMNKFIKHIPVNMCQSAIDSIKKKDKQKVLSATVIWAPKTPYIWSRKSRTCLLHKCISLL